MFESSFKKTPQFNRDKEFSVAGKKVLDCKGRLIGTANCIRHETKSGKFLEYDQKIFFGLTSRWRS